MFEFSFSYYVLLMISVNVTIHLLNIGFVKCFVKMHLTIVGGCQMFVFDLFYNVLFMISLSWKGQTEAYSVLYVSFISVS